MNLQMIFVEAWRRQSSWLMLLVPLELIYRLLNYINWLIKTKLFNRHSLKIPLIVIGSISLGGSGKTPAVISLINELTTRGFKVGIISRGYKGDNKTPKEVFTAANPNEVGDEPLLIACATGCPVCVGADRYLTAKYLLKRHKVDVIVSDDGLQHYRLAADIEVALLDDSMRLSNRHCLPVGPLREPPKRLAKVDFIVMNLANRSDETTAQKTQLPNLDIADENIYSMTRKSISYIKLSDNNLANSQRSPEATGEKTVYTLAEWLKLTKGKQVHAVAGIAQPQNFFNLLKGQGLSFIPHAFANHHKFSATDINFGESEIIIMTEKDAIKCSEFSGAGNLWALRINYELDASLINHLVAKL